MNRVIMVGSPRVNGRSASLADELLYACIEECPDDVVSIVSVASTHVEPCNGCDACAEESDEVSTGMEEGDPLTPHPAVAASDASRHRCAIADDMLEVRKHLDAADELIVVSPVYFSGPPAQFKALLDRLQPYYRSDLRLRVKRPLILHVIGEGGDPHGYDALVGTVASAFSVAGFQLEAIFDWVGKISSEGEILGDPEEYVLETEAIADPGSASDADRLNGEDQTRAGDAASSFDEPSGSKGSSGLASEMTSKRGLQNVPRKEKPKLSLSQPVKGGKRHAPSHGESVSGNRRKGGSSKQTKRGGKSKGGSSRGGRHG